MNTNENQYKLFTPIDTKNIVKFCVYIILPNTEVALE